MDNFEEKNISPETSPEESKLSLQQQLEAVFMPPSGSSAEAAPVQVGEDPEAEVTRSEQTRENPSENDGFYHGIGTGAKEETLTVGENFSAAETQPDPATTEPVKNIKRNRKKRGIGKIILKYSVLSLLVLALVATGCGISIAIMNQHWKAYNQLMLQNFDAQIQVMREELEAYRNEKADIVIVPTEGLSPSQIYDQNIQSVVAVNCLVRSTSNGQVYEGQASGSGFVLSADGYIVTNFHVIETATSVSIVFADGKSLQAQYVGGDQTNDIAVLKVEATNLQPVKIGKSSKLQVGDQVVAIGNALGELNFSLTAGYVSGTDRSISTDGSIINMIQTDAAINSGNSGGPLFNAYGEVVGITSAKYSGTTPSGATIEGIGFAIPMDDVIDMLEDLRQYGYITGAYLGVMVQDMDPTVAATYGFPMGAYVREVTPGYAAQRAGVMAKDIITNIGGHKIESMNDLKRVLRGYDAGDKTTICVWRSGRQIVLNIVFDEKPTE